MPSDVTKLRVVAAGLLGAAAMCGVIVWAILHTAFEGGFDGQYLIHGLLAIFGGVPACLVIGARLAAEGVGVLREARREAKNQKGKRQ